MERYKFSWMLCIFYVIMLMIPECMVVNDTRWWDPVVSLPSCAIAYAVLAWSICALVSFCSRKTECILHGILHLVIAAYVVSDVFIVIKFGRHWDVYTLQFLRETNMKEASEFISSFVFTPLTLFLVFSCLLFFSFEIRLVSKAKRMPLLPKRKWQKAVWGIVVIGVYAHIIYFSPDNKKNFELMARFPSPLKRCDILENYQSVLLFKEFEAQYDRCAKQQETYRENAKCDEQDADFVLIIGESFNRHMSNIYDGKYNTNPLLKKREEAGRLFVFNDVISSSNGTSQNFKYFFSMNSVEGGKAWCDAPMLPTIVQHVGYNVIWYSNQFALNQDLGQFNGTLGFLNHPLIARSMFNHRNESTYPHDLQLISDYASNRRNVERKNRNFVIFHLYGQHISASQRYPHSFGSFTADNVGRKNLGANEREEIAHYLNATEYNDFVVDSILRMFDNRNAIVLYLSDHGEEIYNFRNQLGRTDLSTETDHRALQAQLDVPFMIYITPTYERLHPTLPSVLRSSANRPFMTDDMPHVVCNILGIHSKWYVPERSIVNSLYKPHKHRMLQKESNRTVYYD